MLIFKGRMPFFLLLICAVLACLPLTGLADDDLTDMLKITLSVYALARGLNAVISMAQGTSLSVEPMGVGVTLTPGQVLDPLNDLVEQFALLLLLASASLGVQQIIVELGDIAVLRYGLAVVCLLLAIASFIKPALFHSGISRWALGFVVVLTLLRFAVPVMALASGQLQDWLAPERVAAVSVLDETQAEVTAIHRDPPGTDRPWYQGLRDSLDIQQRLKSIQSHAEQGIEAAVYLIAEFLLVMLLLPLFTGFIIYRLLSRLLRARPD